MVSGLMAEVQPDFRHRLFSGHMPDEPVEVNDRQSRPAGQNRNDEPMLYCPVCDEKLISRKCTLLCERCGYFMSCADSY